MKKRLAILFLGLAVLGWAAVAGPYIEAENVGLVLEPTLLVGANFGDTIGDTLWSFAADLSYFDNNLLALGSPWEIALDLDLVWSSALSLAAGSVIDYGVEFEIVETLVFDPANYPNFLGIDEFLTELMIVGFYGPLRVWAGAAFPFALVNPPGPPGLVGTWGFIPVVGVSVGR